MSVAYLVVAVPLAALLIVSGTLLVRRQSDVTTTMTELGVPPGWFRWLALAKYAGALGLLAGIVHRPLGVAASAGVLCYFLGAVVAHLRAGHATGVPVPAGVAVAATAALLFGLESG